MKKLIKSLFESPDVVYKYNSEWGYNQTYAKYNDDDAFAFGYIDNKIYINNTTHTKIAPTEILKKESEKRNITFPREAFDYPGRIWLEKKVISFWIYPENNKKLKEIIHDIENALLEKFNIEIDIWNDPNFKIEINELEFELPPSDSDDWDRSDFAWYKYKEDSIKLIPLKLYKSSKNQSEEEFKKDHIISPLNKKKSDVPEGWGDWYYKDAGSPERLKWKFAHKNENKKEQLINRLFESPDFVYIPEYDITIRWDEGDTIAFGYFEDKLLVGDYQETHGDILENYLENDDYFDDETGELLDVNDLIQKEQEMGNNVYDTRQLFDYPGRIWLDEQIVSFWEYPINNYELHKIIKELEDILSKKFGSKISIWNDDYKIEIIDNEFKNLNSLKDELKGEWEDYYDENENKFYEPKSKLIPITKYKSSLDFDEKNSLAIEKQVNQRRWNKNNYPQYNPEKGNKNPNKKGSPEYLKWKFAHKNENKDSNNLMDSIFD